MKSQIADFFSLIYPRICENCGTALTRKEEFLCLSCELSLPKSPYLTNKDELLNKFVVQPKITAAYAYLDFIKDGMVQRLIHRLKYHHKPEMGVWLGLKFGNELIKHLSDTPDLIIPSPLHPKREKFRGYNQSEKISQGLSQVLAVPINSNMILRTTHRASQTRKSRVSRWQNVEDVFSESNNNGIENKRILVVDDVLTSGATMGHLCDTLAIANPKEIYVAALAAAR